VSFEKRVFDRFHASFIRFCSCFEGFGGSDGDKSVPHGPRAKIFFGGQKFSKNFSENFFLGTKKFFDQKFFRKLKKFSKIFRSKNGHHLSVFENLFDFRSIPGMNFPDRTVSSHSWPRYYDKISKS